MIVLQEDKNDSKRRESYALGPLKGGKKLNIEPQLGNEMKRALKPAK